MQLGTAVLIVIHWMGCMVSRALVALLTLFLTPYPSIQQWMLCRLNAFPEESWVVHAGK